MAYDWLNGNIEDLSDEDEEALAEAMKEVPLDDESEDEAEDEKGDTGQ